MVSLREGSQAFVPFTLSQKSGEDARYWTARGSIDHITVFPKTVRHQGSHLNAGPKVDNPLSFSIENASNAIVDTLLRLVV